MSKKEKILTSAIEKFNYYGISKTTMQDIASGAGIAVGTLYLYFKNKDEIILAGVQKYIDYHRQQAKKIINSDILASQKLKEYFVDRFRAAKETRTHSLHSIEMTKAVIKLKPDRVREESNWFMENLILILEEGVKNKEFFIKDIYKDSEVFLFSIAIFFPLATWEILEEPQEEKLIQTIDWFIDKWSIK